MARKTTEAPAHTALATAEMLKLHWPLFKEFQAQLQEDHPAREIIQHVNHLIEADEDACIAIFGAGLAAGIQAMLTALADAHEMLHVEEMMQHTPDKKRPRA